MKKTLLVLAAVALLAFMIPAAFADVIPKPCTCTPGRTPGYWKHNINVANGGNGAYSWYWGDFKLNYDTVVAIVSDAGFASLQAALDALTPPGADAATREAAAFALNEAAGLNPEILV